MRDLKGDGVLHFFASVVSKVMEGCIFSHHGTTGPWDRGTMGPWALRAHGPWALRAQGRALRARWVLRAHLSPSRYAENDFFAPYMRSKVCPILVAP